MHQQDLLLKELLWTAAAVVVLSALLSVSAFAASPNVHSPENVHDKTHQAAGFGLKSEDLQ